MTTPDDAADSRSGHYDDPRWQTAQHEYLDDMRPGEDENGVYFRRCDAAYEMYLIEAEHRGDGAKPMRELLRQTSALSADYLAIADGRCAS
jgi:hypothetical protein